MEFENVKVIKKANLYFSGNVNSRTIIFEDGTKKTLGFMLKGEYTFNTGKAEIMELLGGKMLVKLKGEKEYKLIQEGESFNVPASSSFDLIVEEYADYCCSYVG